MRTEQPKVIHPKDYQAPDYLIDQAQKFATETPVKHAELPS